MLLKIKDRRRSRLFEDHDIAETQASMDKKFTVEQIKSALLAVKAKITVPQWAMLRGHYLHRAASMEKIARFGGYDTWRARNSQYGALCGRIARELEFVAPGHPRKPGLPRHADQTYAIASVSPERDANGHSQRRMDDAVARALEELDWVSPISGEVPQASDSPADFGQITETE